MADQRDLEAAAGIAPRLCVHLGDERANGVHDLEAALRALLVDLGRDAVRREDDQLALGNLVLGLDEHRAARLEVADDMDVVDDLVAHVDRRPVLLEQLLDDVDRAHHSCAEAPGRGDENALAHDRASSASAEAARRRAAVAFDASRAVRKDLTGSCRERRRDDLPVGASVRLARADEPPDRLVAGIGDRAHDSGQPPGGREHAALHVHNRRPALLGKRAAGLGLVGDAVGGDNDRGLGAGDLERGPVPERAPGRIHHLRRRDERAGTKRFSETAREAERDELPFG